MQYLLLPKENAEVILNIVAKRLKWNDANEIMAIIKDLKPVRITDEGKESEDQTGLLKNKFSGTGDRNEKKGPKEALPPSASGDTIWGGPDIPVY